MTTTTNQAPGQSPGPSSEPLQTPPPAQESAESKNGFKRAGASAQRKVGQFKAGLKEVSGWDLDIPRESVEDEDDIDFMRDTSVPAAAAASA